MTMPRLIVDPNSISRYHPGWSAVLLRDATIIPEVGQEVIAVQDDPDGPDYISTAIVQKVDTAIGLIYVKVDWDGFHDEEPEA
jgi:hypothetical protein